MPTWNGNLFELAGGEPAPIRTFTPRYFDAATDTLTIDVVAHESGVASDWSSLASAGDEVAVSGPGRGYEIDVLAAGYLLAGDESAMPAISQLLEQLPEDISVQVLIEIATPDARLDLPAHPSSQVRWLEAADGAEPGASMVAAITALDEVPAVVWVAGEAAAVQKIRRHLFDDRGLSRSAATVRGYWKHGR